MPNTLLLDTLAWDLVLDSFGNIALAEEPYALAQDASSEVKVFLGECYYDTTKGVPYFQQVLGKFPPIAIIKNSFTQAALQTPNVAQAKVFLQVNSMRTITPGQIQITSASGETLIAPSGPSVPVTVVVPTPAGLSPPPPPPPPPTPLPPPPPPPPGTGTPGEFDFSDPAQSDNTGLQ